MDATIAELIAAHSGIPAGTSVVQETDLYQAGMRSFAAVQLMLALEEAFEIQFPEEMLDRATFRSPGAIMLAISQLAPNAFAASGERKTRQPVARQVNGNGAAPARAAPVSEPAAPAPLLERLIGAGLLIPTGVAGLYGRSGTFEAVIAAFDALVTREGAEGGPEVLRFPPAIPLRQLEANGYMKNFPQLAGTVHAFCGGDDDHLHLIGQIDAGEDWTRGQAATQIALTPAACYPLYPLIAAQGPLASGGRLFDVQTYCFRHEPSADPARMQMFRMREYVRAGAREEVLAFREGWMERASAIAERLQLPFELAVANDPFFGRAGRVTISSQREQELKFELLIPVSSDSSPTACISFNYHRDHMAELWDLRLADGTRAHSACIGFGLERTVLALFRHHGMACERWPAGVRAALWG